MCFMLQYDIISYYAYNNCAQGYEYWQNSTLTLILTGKELKLKKLFFGRSLKTSSKFEFLKYNFRNTERAIIFFYFNGHIE